MIDAMREGARLLQQFARFPTPGQVKTRLQPALTAAEACEVHEQLLRRTALTLLDAGLGNVELWMDRPDAHPLIEELLAAGIIGPFRQEGDDLGQRMYHALHTGLDRAAAVVLVGSDCPELDGEYLDAAFQALETVDLVLGPAEDGGYVLIGCRSIEAGLLSGITWGTDSVLRDTQRRAEALGFSCELLATRYDVDRPQDLERWRRAETDADQA